MIPINSIVALKREAEELYREATSPARAIVKRHRTDDYGFEKIYVEWDKDHWRCEGEADRWTYASHFDVVSVPDDAYEEEEESEGKVTDLGGALEAASKIVAQGEGFVMVSLQRDTEGDLIPQIIISASTDEAEDIFDQEILPLLGFEDV